MCLSACRQLYIVGLVVDHVLVYAANLCGLFLDADDLILYTEIRKFPYVKEVALVKGSINTDH